MLTLTELNFKERRAINRGSVFRKWDLHIHTPSSYESNYRFINDEERDKYNGDIWEKYITELEHIGNIAVIGITDYFSIEGYERVLEYKRKGRLSNYHLILPNIEFRLSYITDQDRRLNLHVIFSDQLSIRHIKDFLNDVKLKLSSPHSLIAQGVSCTKEGLIEVGRSYSNNEELPEEEAWKLGCKQAVIDFNTLCEVFAKTHRLDGNYLLVGVEDSRGGTSEIPYEQSGHLRLEIYRQLHIIDSANEKTREFWLGKAESTNMDELEERFGGLKPTIHGSDGHSFDRLCKPDKDRFCWIKADPSFEGLKQIVYEPEDRVRIQKNTPEPRKSIYSINLFHIPRTKINEELVLKKQSIPFNTNLVAVIGGKGSGKTALLDLIANCFENRCRKSGKEIDKNSFVQRIEKEKPKLKVKLVFCDNTEFTKELTKGKFFQSSKISYLPQGKIEEISSEREKLHRKITEIVFRSPAIINTDFKKKYDHFDNEFRSINRNVTSINNKIFEYEKETSSKISREIGTRKKNTQGELVDKETQLKNLMESLSLDSKDRIDNLKEEEALLRTQLLKSEVAEKKLTILFEKIHDLSNFNLLIEELSNDLKDLGYMHKIPVFDFKLQLEAFNSIKTFLNGKRKNVDSEMSFRSSELVKLSGIDKEIRTLVTRIEEIKDNVRKIERELKEIDEMKNEMAILTKRRKIKYTELIKKKIKFKHHYDEIIQVFSQGKDEILDDTDFKAHVHFDKDTFEKKGFEILDHRRVVFREMKDLSKMLEEILTNKENIELSIKKFLKKAHKYKKSLKTTINDLYFDNWLFDDYFTLSTEIFFQDKHMSNLSIGQRGTALLKIVLAEGEYPLIIDQPEENLDNRFIYTVLVNTIRKAKNKRQIIIATHNANLVVNTDAEEVIVANYDDNNISYKKGSIEDKEIRDEITSLLEGGEEAFKKRERRYGLTTL